MPNPLCSFRLVVSVAVVAAVYSSSLEYKCPGLPICHCNKEETFVDCGKSQLSSIPNVPETALRLNLGQNSLTIIPHRAFLNLSKLERLDLNKNKITAIRPYAFEGLECLKKLDLGSNSLQVLLDDSLAKLPSLKTFYCFRQSP